MLSTMQKFAAGAVGQETLTLWGDDQVVAGFTNVGGDASVRDDAIPSASALPLTTDLSSTSQTRAFLAATSDR